MRRIENDKGIEENFSENFLAPYMFSELLLEDLLDSEGGRIINIVSDLYKRGKIDLDNMMSKDGNRSTFDSANSIIATVLYTVELADRTDGENTTVNLLHLGTLATTIARDFPGFILKIMNLDAEKPVKGSERIAYLATADEVSGVAGKYYFKDKQSEINIPPQESNKTEAPLDIAEELILDCENVNN